MINNSKKKTFTSNEITYIYNPNLLKNNTMFPKFEYEGGDGFQNVIFHLKPNEAIEAEGGAMNYMTNDIKINTTAGNKITNAIGRFFSGSSVFFNLFVNQGSSMADISFSGINPGNIGCFYIPVGKTIHLVAHSYVCSTAGLKVTGVARTGGIITGYGLFYVSITAEKNPGLIWINSFGNVIKKVLNQNDKIAIDNGVLLGFDSTINISTSTVGGVKSTLLSGEGLITQIINENTIPVTIYLQGRSNSAYMKYICKTCKSKNHVSNGFSMALDMVGGKQKTKKNKKTNIKK